MRAAGGGPAVTTRRTRRLPSAVSVQLEFGVCWEPRFGEFLFTFCHKGGVICMPEVINISSSNLNSSLCFIQPSVSHDGKD